MRRAATQSPNWRVTPDSLFHDLQLRTLAPSAGRATSTVRTGGTTCFSRSLIDTSRGQTIVVRADAVFVLRAFFEALRRDAIRLPANDVLERRIEIRSRGPTTRSRSAGRYRGFQDQAASWDAGPYA